MGKIRSALEIALERTESVKSDKVQIGKFEAKQKGKKLANEFLAGNIKSLEDEIKKSPKEEQQDFKQGIFDILGSRITLPAEKEELSQLELVCQGLIILIGKKHFSNIAQQLLMVMNRYLDETAQYEEAIKQQYAPKLRQKEEEIAKRLGREISLDPFQDPEFVAFYNQHMNALKANYQTVPDEVRAEAARLFEEL